MKHFLTRLRAWWPGRPPPRSPSAPPAQPVLIVVEGANDILFLKNISSILSRGDPSLPDLLTWELDGRCLFLPTGGDVARWTLRLAGLQLPQLHVYDRESGAVTDSRRAHVALLNLRPDTRAYLTSKLALENYLHSAAVRDALAITSSRLCSQVLERVAARWPARQRRNGPAV
jgi:hypothetical protein